MKILKFSLIAIALLLGTTGCIHERNLEIVVEKQHCGTPKCTRKRNEALAKAGNPLGQHICIQGEQYLFTKELIGTTMGAMIRVLTPNPVSCKD